MKRFISLVLSLCMLTSAFGQGVNFVEGPLKATLKKAKSEKKLVFIDCYTSWCIPCANMARNIFPQKECGNYMNKLFVSTKFDMEKGEGLELQKTFKCIVYPTFIILDADGKEINRLTGGSNSAGEFLDKLKTAISPDGSLDNLRKAYEENKCMQTGMAYAKAMYDHGYNIAETLEDIYMNSAEYERYNTEFLMYYLNSIDFRSERFDRLMNDKRRWNEMLGREYVDRMIFDSYRKTMYLVAAGRPHELSTEDVRKAAMITGFLSLPEGSTERYLPTVASCIINKDWDGFIDVYERHILHSAVDSYRPIMDSFISMHRSQFNDKQKERLIKALELAARSDSYQAQSYERIINQLNGKSDK